jgi:large subunit ribosomal protein L21
MSFAIIETGGKQYKVSASKILEVEKLEVEEGKTIKFKNVLLLNDDKSTVIGSPNIDGAIVEAQLIANVKDRTVLIFHKRRRKHSRKKNGHRQRHSKIQITKILSKDGKVISEFKIESKKETKIIKAEEKKETKIIKAEEKKETKIIKAEEKKDTKIIKAAVKKEIKTGKQKVKKVTKKK